MAICSLNPPGYLAIVSENEADVAPDPDKLRSFMPANCARGREAPLLNVAEAADERQESCLAEAGGPVMMTSSPGSMVKSIRKRILFEARRTEVVLQAGDLESLSIVFLRHGRTPLATSAEAPGVQDTSAGAVIQSSRSRDRPRSRT